MTVLQTPPSLAPEAGRPRIHHLVIVRVRRPPPDRLRGGGGPVVLQLDDLCVPGAAVKPVSPRAPPRLYMSMAVLHTKQTDPSHPWGVQANTNVIYNPLVQVRDKGIVYFICDSSYKTNRSLLPLGVPSKHECNIQSPCPSVGQTNRPLPPLGVQANTNATRMQTCVSRARSRSTAAQCPASTLAWLQHQPPTS